MAMLGLPRFQLKFCPLTHIKDDMTRKEKRILKEIMEGMRPALEALADS